MAARKPRYSDWSNNPTADAAYRQDDEDTAAAGNYRYLLNAMRSKAPGQWSQNVLELSQHFTNAAFIAINTLANQAANCERQVFERTALPNEADLELPWSEPINRFLDQPNDEDDWSDFMYQVSQQLSLTGIALVWKPTEGQAAPGQMYVLPTCSCLPMPVGPEYPNGMYLVQPYYPYGPFSAVAPGYQSAAGARIPADQVIRIKNPNPILRYDGYAVLTALRRQMDTVDSIDAARWSAQRRGVDPSLIMTFDPEVYNPANQPDLNRLRVQLDALYSGPDNAGRIFPAPIGTTLSKLSATPSEMAWQEGWDQLVKFVMAGYGCPALIAGLVDATTYASTYAAQKQFHLISLDPHLKRIASQLNSQLVRLYYGDDLYLRLSGKRVNDDDVQLARMSLGVQGKVVTNNELRKFCDLPPAKGDQGDVYVGSDQPTAGPTTHHVEDAAPPGSGAPEPVTPDAADSSGSLPPRKQWAGDRLATVLERAKVRGVATKIGDREKNYLSDFDRYFA